MAIEPEWKFGTVKLPESGAENGVYISELQTRPTEKNLIGNSAPPQVFLPPQVVIQAGHKPTDLKEGQLVRYQVHPQSPTMAKQVELK